MDDLSIRLAGLRELVPPGTNCAARAHIGIIPNSAHFSSKNKHFSEKNDLVHVCARLRQSNKGPLPLKICIILPRLTSCELHRKYDTYKESMLSFNRVID